MGRLVYSALTSIDGYVADTDGRFDWAEPDEEVHRFVNELERAVGTSLYVRTLKAEAGRDLSIGGAELAGQALKAGLVDELHLFVSPVVVGGGTAALPADVRLDLELLDEHRFDNGVVHLHYRLRD